MSKEVTTQRQEFLNGVRDTVPLVVGSIPFGILFGALAVSVGLSVPATIAMSLIVFAGSAQFIAAGLVSQGAGVLVIIMTTLIVNLRHALYGASLGPYLRNLSQRWVLPLAFWLTDEVYAVVVQRYERADASPHKNWYYLGSCVFMYVNWQICTLVGVVAGTQLDGISEWGLEFAMVVTFIGIVVPMLKNLPMVLAALIAGGVALWLRELPHQLGLMFASLAGIAVGYIASRASASPQDVEVSRT